MNAIVDRIEELLQKQNLSVNNMIKDLELTVNPFSWKSRGTVPKADVAIRISHYLGVSVEYLITGEESDWEKVSALNRKIEGLSEAKKESLNDYIDFLREKDLRS